MVDFFETIQYYALNSTSLAQHMSGSFENKTNNLQNR